MINRFEEYAEHVRRLYAKNDGKFDTCRDITLQITSECNLNCSYCYEHHKEHQVMSLETGKKIVDYLLNMYVKNDNEFINHNTQAIVLSFIGGEPLLEAKLIEQICDYWFSECYKKNIPIASHTRICFATNGQLWFSKDAQHLIKKYHDLMSVTISIDGIKDLHDKYRIDKNGNGSFNLAYAAFNDAKKYGWNYSKMTFVPSSFNYIYDSIKMMIEEGCEQIHCNCAYEPVYTQKDASLLYDQLCKVADYMIDNNLQNFISILDDFAGNPNTDNQNYCGGTGKMLAFSPDGKAYPCIRYAPISIGKEKADEVCIGDCNNGLYQNEKQIKIKNDLDSITRISQSPQKCLDCKISTGCGWCSGYNYECYGTANCRSTNICYAHKGRVLACCYYYNKRSIELNDCDPKHLNLDLNEIIEIVGKEKAELLLKLEANAFSKKSQYIINATERM